MPRFSRRLCSCHSVTNLFEYEFREVYSVMELDFDERVSSWLKDGVIEGDITHAQHDIWAIPKPNEFYQEVADVWRDANRAVQQPTVHIPKIQLFWEELHALYDRDEKENFEGIWRDRLQEIIKLFPQAGESKANQAYRCAGSGWIKSEGKQ